MSSIEKELRLIPYYQYRTVLHRCQVELGPGWETGPWVREDDEWFPGNIVQAAMRKLCNDTD